MLWWYTSIVFSKLGSNFDSAGGRSQPRGCSAPPAARQVAVICSRYRYTPGACTNDTCTARGPDARTSRRNASSTGRKVCASAVDAPNTGNNHTVSHTKRRHNALKLE